MTTLTDQQSRALLDFALAQVRHLLPDPLPPNLEYALQDLAPGQPGFRGATYYALSVLEAQRGQATNLAAREAARLARLALAHAACDNFPSPENLPEALQARDLAIQQHKTEGLQAGNHARQLAMLAQKDYMASIGGSCDQVFSPQSASSPPSTQKPRSPTR